MAWELSAIKARHKCIIDLHLAGLKNVDIAEQMDCTDVSVGMILRSPIVQAEIARRRTTVDRKVDDATANVIQRAKQIMENASTSAAQKLVEQIDHDDPRVAQAAAKSILEETFGSGVSKTPHSVIQINISQMAVLQQALREISSPSSLESSL